MGLSLSFLFLLRSPRREEDQTILVESSSLATLFLFSTRKGVFSVLSGGGVRPYWSRHLRGVETSFPRCREVLWTGDLILLHIRTVPEDVAAGGAGRVLRRYCDDTGLLQILFAIERLLRHVLPVYGILTDVVHLHGLRGLIGVALLVTVLVALSGGGGAGRRDVFQALRGTLSDRLQHVSGHAGRGAVVGFLKTVDAVRISHVDRGALWSTADDVSHPFSVLCAQTLSRCVRDGDTVPRGCGRRVV